MGTHGPTCALSGQWYCQERCGIWPKSLGTPTKHTESSIMRWQKWLRVFVMMWLSVVMYGMSTQSCSGMTVSICQRAGYMTGWQAILVSVTDHAFSTSSELLSKCYLTTVKYHSIVGVIKTFSKDNNEVALWITRKSSTQAWGTWRGKEHGEKNIKSRWKKINPILFYQEDLILNCEGDTTQLMQGACGSKVSLYMGHAATTDLLDCGTAWSHSKCLYSAPSVNHWILVFLLTLKRKGWMLDFPLPFCDACAVLQYSWRKPKKFSMLVRSIKKPISLNSPGSGPPPRHPMPIQHRSAFKLQLLAQVLA